jgi:hypothetical protein
MSMKCMDIGERAPHTPGKVALVKEDIKLGGYQNHEI